MPSRSRLLLAFFAMVLLAGVGLGGPAVAAAATTKGSGGWYWPTGTENFGGMDGYWTYRASNHSWHMAQDMASPEGHYVYAIADGVVAESQADAGYGGVLVIWHTTGDGQKFLAVYGHIIRRSLAKGAKVTAGQVIGIVNSADHVHFGVHPGASYPPDRNPYRGHTYTSSNTYGWVDPVKFLRQHPAYLSYAPPALPLIATVSTVSTPTVLGVAEGTVYWTVTSDDETPAVFARALPSGETTELAEDAQRPPLDTTRYLAVTAATSFSLYDRLPALTAKYSALNPAWKRPLCVTGTLNNAVGKPFSGAKVWLERSYSGGTPWVAVATGVTGLQGTYSLAYVPPRICFVRVTFTPPTTFISAATGKIATASRPGLHAPDTAKQTTSKRRVSVSGKLDARHPAKSHTVTLHFQRLRPAGWTDVPCTWSACANSGAGSRYSRTLTLAAGTWRVRASCSADGLHAAESTKWVGFTVKR